MSFRKEVGAPLVHAQRHGVDEHADELLGVGVAAPGDRRTDGEVVLAAPLCEQRVVGREQHDEGGRAGGAGERFDGEGALPAELEGVPGARVVDLRGPKAVGRQVEHRRAGEAGAPGLEVGAAADTVDPVALPGRDVAVPDGQGPELRGPAAGIGSVELPQVAQQQAGGRAVADDVVHGQQQYLVIRAEAGEVNAQQRADGEIERSVRPLGEPGPCDVEVIEVC